MHEFLSDKKLIFTGDPREKPQGVGFLFHFSDEASPNKNPTYDFHFLSDIFQVVNNGDRISTFY